MAADSQKDQMEAGEAILQRIDETVSRLKAIQDKTMSMLIPHSPKHCH